MRLNAVYVCDRLTYYNAWRKSQSTDSEIESLHASMFHVGKNDRRAYPALSSNVFQGTVIESTAMVDPRSRAPIVMAQNRQFLESVLDRQFQLANEKGYPISIALIALQQEIVDEPRSTASEAILNTVAKICRSHVRPSDLIFRYGESMLVLVCLQSTEEGTTSVAARLKTSLARPLFFGKRSVTVHPMFAVSGVTSGFGSAGNSLLKTAESVFIKAIALKTDLASAAQLGIGHVSSDVNNQDIANAITGMYEPYSSQP